LQSQIWLIVDYRSVGWDNRPGTHLHEIRAAQEHAHRAVTSGVPAKLEFFTPEQASEVEAVAAQIIPADATPGAREAEVIYFIDRALVTFDKDKQKAYRKGLGQLQRKAGKKRFSELASERQIALLKKIQKSEFFELVRVHTIMGFFANPEHGGNRDRIGWRLIGFEDGFSWEPPFGYYDRVTNDKWRKWESKNSRIQESKNSRNPGKLKKSRIEEYRAGRFWI
jgi:gluconate 2-dehydrogenase gamma chain